MAKITLLLSFDFQLFQNTAVYRPVFLSSLQKLLQISSILEQLCYYQSL